MFGECWFDQEVEQPGFSRRILGLFLYGISQHYDFQQLLGRVPFIIRCLFCCFFRNLRYMYSIERLNLGP